jgi:predicted amidohydrolase
MQICTINFDTVWKNPKANLEKKEILIKQALEINKAVDTIVFPELSFT